VKNSIDFHIPHSIPYSSIFHIHIAIFHILFGIAIAFALHSGDILPTWISVLPGL
jgi:hypothetical protein